MSAEPIEAIRKRLDDVYRLTQALITARSSSEAREARLQHAEMIYRARRRRDEIFGTDLFGEPAFDILLDLYVSREKRRQVSVTSACIAAAVPPTTALRYIVALQERGLVERCADPFDKRRCHLVLTERAVTAMERFLDRA